MKILTLLAAFAIGHAALAQTGDITIMRGGKFKADGQTLKPREVLKLMESNPEAYAAFRKAKSNYDAGQALGFVGGFLIGWPLGTALGGGEPQWGLAGAGAVVLLCTIPLNSGFKKHANHALDLYNNKPNARENFRPTFHLNVQGTGAKLTMRF